MKYLSKRILYLLSLVLFILPFNIYSVEIEGIKLRLKKSDTSYHLHFGDHEDILTNEDYNRTQDLVQFPLELVLLEEVDMGGDIWGVTVRVYLDFELRIEGKDLAPEKFSSNRSTLYDSFLTDEEKSIADNYPSWTLSADYNTSSIVWGVKVGYFFGTAEGINRFVKFGIGVDYVYMTYNIDLKLCESYRIEGDEGICVNGRNVDESSGSILSVQISTYFTLWELRTKNFALSVYEISTAPLIDFGFPLLNQNLDLENHEYKGIKLERNLSSTTLISFTYLF